MSDLWGIYIAAVVIISIIGLTLLLFSQAKTKVKKDGEQVETMGHVWDDDLEEYNHPLPRWWMYLFYATLIFSVGYLILYPGLGKFPGLIGWTSVSQYNDERNAAEKHYLPLYQKYYNQDIKVVATDPDALAMGSRLFQTYCVQCHGLDGRGSKGFPNLTDNDWLYGGSPATIEATIAKGRHGQMPAWGAALGEEKIKDTANYVRSLSGLKHDSERAQRGAEIFKTNCAVCHGPDGKGNQSLGAPNLTDKVWLYGSSEKAIIETITNGRSNQMPAWEDFLGKEKVHLLAAYVWGLSDHR